SARVDVLIRLHRRRPRPSPIRRFGADRPRLAAEVAVVEARQAADGVEKQPAVHLDELGMADGATAGKVARVHLAQRGERPPVIARLEYLEARPRRTDLAPLAAPEHEQDAAVETDHLGVLVVQSVGVDDPLARGEAGRSAA